MSRSRTPSQTIGPFFGHALTPSNNLRSAIDHRIRLPGRRITLTGQVYDGAGTAVEDAMVEVWQAKGNTGAWARSATTGDGFLFEAIKGEPAAPGAPAINLVVFMRGLLVHVHTRIYFADEAAANDSDPFLATIDPDLRPRLLAEAQGNDRYHVDLFMQGPRATPWIDL